MLEKILENYREEELLKADSFDDAIIGVAEDMNEPLRLVYSVKKCLDILCKEMDYDDAIEHFNFNVAGAYVGKQTPIWCWDVFE